MVFVEKEKPFSIDFAYDQAFLFELAPKVLKMSVSFKPKGLALVKQVLPGLTELRQTSTFK